VSTSVSAPAVTDAGEPMRSTKRIRLTGDHATRPI